MTTQEMIIKEKCEFYLEKQIPIHVVTVDARYYNGVLVDVNDTRLILLDKKYGEMFIVLEEIKNVEPYIDKEVGE